MGAPEYADLRAFLRELEARGKLYRWTGPVDKDSALMPLMRLQYRGIPDEDRKAFLFENVTDARGRGFDMQVVTGVYGASRAITALGLGCEDPGELYERWHHAVNHPIEPVLVDRGAVQEEVHLGPDVAELGLDELPAPVEDPGFSGTLRTCTPFITKDFATGIRNVGTYSGFFKAPNRMSWGIGYNHHGYMYHWRSALARAEAMPVAITVGTLPDIVAVGSAPLPYGADELAIAGGLRGRPVELVRCQTVPLEVPAEAEIVIEGEVSSEYMEPEDCFSDWPGYVMVEKAYRPVINVTAITHRRRALFTSMLVGMAPNECNSILRTCREMMLYSFLKYGCNIPEVLEITCPEVGGGRWTVIRMRKSHPSKPRQALQAASGMDPSGKVFIVVDEDLDPTDPEMVMWALTTAMQPHHDAQVITGRVPGLDPSAYPLMTKSEDRSYPPPVGCSALLINATRKGAYPPVGLPKREFMERALKLWEAEGLPALRLKRPWYGYPLGLWTAEDDAMARHAVNGDYHTVGERSAQLRQPVSRFMSEAPDEGAETPAPNGDGHTS
jgi:4-hydroxy-3-polyprenylbenzoate decarboxylase